MIESRLGLPEPTLNYIRRHGLREPGPLADLRQRTEPLPQAYYQLGPEVGCLLDLLIKLMGARRILDIGTFTGYSAMAAALSAGPEADVRSFDVSAEFTAIARQAWRDAGVDDRIHLELGPAAACLDKLYDVCGDGWFDMAIIDADKEGYDGYYERCLRLVRQGGLIIMDNVLWRGTAIDPGQAGAKGQMLDALSRKIRDDPRVVPLILPISDGVNVIRIVSSADAKADTNANHRNTGTDC